MRTIRNARNLLLGCGLAALLAATAHAEGVKVIVNSGNRTSSLGRDKVVQIFLKKETSFPGGQAAIPVDQVEAAPVRREFSKLVLARDASAVVTYWNQMIFSGRATPPKQMSSDDEVLTFIRNNANAIGYVSADKDVGAGIRVVTIN